jgi:NADH-quinone oxidoreductase subunit C
MHEPRAILGALGRASSEGDAWPEGRRELRLEPGELVAAMAALKALGGLVLLDICAVDRPEGFEVAYRLLDAGGQGAVGLLALRVSVGRDLAALPSIMGVWKAADVLEREVWDLMGIRFEGRGGLKRILCKDDFEGHPLRKDFAVPSRPRFDGGLEP